MLLQRRPSQESAPKYIDKVPSIGRQCGYDQPTTTIFERLGQEGERILNELSGLKQKSLDRHAIGTHFQKGVLHLSALLTAIDETKLRNLL